MPPPVKGQHLQDAIQGYAVYLGTIDCTGTSKTNHQATTAFNNTGEGLSGKVLMLVNEHTDVIRIYPVKANDGTVTVTRAAGAAFGFPIQPGAALTMNMGDAYSWLAAVAASGAGKLDEFEKKG